MKGIVFVELLKLIEDQHGLVFLDDVIQRAELPNKGAYTAVGTYPHSEMISLVTALSDLSGLPVDEALQLYGSHLFHIFTKSYPAFFEGVDSSIRFLASVNDYIHVEVRKLYPDAELPKIYLKAVDDDNAVVTYRSSRPFAHLALGLVRGCLVHFNDGFTAQLSECNNDATACVINVGRAN